MIYSYRVCFVQYKNKKMAAPKIGGPVWPNTLNMPNAGADRLTQKTLLCGQSL